MDEALRKKKMAQSFRATPGDCITVTLTYKGEELAKSNRQSKPPKVRR